MYGKNPSERLCIGMGWCDVNQRNALTTAYNLAKTEDLQQAIADIAIASRRALILQKQRKDYERDRRVLLGVRVPVEFHAACKADAERKGISLYKWCNSAFQSYLHS